MGRAVRSAARVEGVLAEVGRCHSLASAPTVWMLGRAMQAEWPASSDNHEWGCARIRGRGTQVARGHGRRGPLDMAARAGDVLGGKFTANLPENKKLGGNPLGKPSEKNPYR